MRIIATFIVYIPLAVADHMEALPEGLGTWGKLAVYLVPYVLIGWDIVYKAFRNIKNGQVFDENFLMSVATFGAFGIGEYSEAVAVMLFYQVGELFQSYAVNRSRQSITELMDICPDTPTLRRTDSLSRWTRMTYRWAISSWLKPGRGFPWTARWYSVIPWWTPRPLPVNRFQGRLEWVMMSSAAVSMEAGCSGCRLQRN